jgi:hypothetical protein
MAMMSATAMLRARHGLGRDRFSTISRSLGIAGRLLYAAGSSLSLSSRLLRLRRSSFGARGSLISAIGRVYGALRWIWLTRRASCRKRKG